MGVHDFSPTIEWGCIRDFISLMRKGPTNLSTEEKCEAGQHVCWFTGCAFGWYANRDNKPEGDDSILRMLLELFSAKTFGSESEMSIEDLCDRCEEALPPEDSYGQVESPVVVLQILSIVVPLVIELWRKLR